MEVYYILESGMSKSTVLLESSMSKSTIITGV